MQISFCQIANYSFPLFAPILWPNTTNPYFFFTFNEEALNQINQTRTHPQIFQQSTNQNLTYTGEAVKILRKKKRKCMDKRKVADATCSKRKKFQIINLNLTERRNIIPNTVNHILSYLQRKNKSFRFVQLCISKLSKSQNPYSALRFYSYQLFIKEKLTIFVNKQTLQRVLSHLDQKAPFTLEEQAFYNKIGRIVITHYLKTVSPIVTLNSRRLVQTNRKEHLRSQRNLFKSLQVFFQQTKGDSFLSQN